MKGLTLELSHLRHFSRSDTASWLDLHSGPNWRRSSEIASLNRTFHPWQDCLYCKGLHCRSGWKRCPHQLIQLHFCKAHAMWDHAADIQQSIAPISPTIILKVLRRDVTGKTIFAVSLFGPVFDRWKTVPYAWQLQNDNPTHLCLILLIYAQLLDTFILGCGTLAVSELGLLLVLGAFSAQFQRCGVLSGSRYGLQLIN